MLDIEGKRVESDRLQTDQLLRRMADLESRLRMMQWLVALALIVPPLVPFQLVPPRKG